PGEQPREATLNNDISYRLIIDSSE
ncbi:unnamed protein product, partial [Rotaria sp. Silwood1]